MSLYHIPCDNDASAKATERALKEMGYDVFSALSYHPFATAFVVVETHDGQDEAPILSRGGVKLEETPMRGQEADLVTLDEWLEDETEPDPDDE